MAGWRARAGFWAGVALTLVAGVGGHGGAAGRRPDGRCQGFRRPSSGRCWFAIASLCHGEKKPKGKLRLDNLATDFADAATRARWTAVIERLEAGEMPPKGKPRPRYGRTFEALTGWLAPAWPPPMPTARAAQGRVILRRLNRVEYENTVRDLLGINVNLKEQLPEDGSADGFDNAGAANHTSSFLMEKYLEAADKALNMAIANRPKPPPFTTKRHSIKDGWPVRGSTEKVYRFLKDGEVVCFCSSEWHRRRGDPVLSVRGGQLSFSDLGVGFSKRRQAGHVSRDGNAARN